MDKTSIAKLLLTLTLTAPSLAQAGTWGVGKWGQMYWGSNPETAPTVAPTVNAQGDGTDITFTLTNLISGQQVGWSAITQFEVTCGNQPTVLISASNPRLTNLDPDTEYTCTIVALNEPNGQTGEALLARSPLPLIHSAAYQCGYFIKPLSNPRNQFIAIWSMALSYQRHQRQKIITALFTPKAA